MGEDWITILRDSELSDLLPMLGRVWGEADGAWDCERDDSEDEW
jgi:hypothetical protein